MRTRRDVLRHARVRRHAPLRIQLDQPLEASGRVPGAPKPQRRNGGVEQPLLVTVALQTRLGQPPRTPPRLVHRRRRRVGLLATLLGCLRLGLGARPAVAHLPQRPAGSSVASHPARRLEQLGSAPLPAALAAVAAAELEQKLLQCDGLVLALVFGPLPGALCRRRERLEPLPRGRGRREQPQAVRTPERRLKPKRSHQCGIRRRGVTNSECTRSLPRCIDARDQLLRGGVDCCAALLGTRALGDGAQQRFDRVRIRKLGLFRRVQVRLQDFGVELLVRRRRRVLWLDRRGNRRERRACCVVEALGGLEAVQQPLCQRVREETANCLDDVVHPALVCLSEVLCMLGMLSKQSALNRLKLKTRGAAP